MGEIMNSPKGVKSGVPSGKSEHFLPTSGTRHDLRKITGNRSYVTVGEQTFQYMLHTGVKFVNKVCMTAI